MNAKEFVKKASYFNAHQHASSLAPLAEWMEKLESEKMIVIKEYHKYLDNGGTAILFYNPSTCSFTVQF